MGNARQTVLTNGDSASSSFLGFSDPDEVGVEISSEVGVDVVISICLVSSMDGDVFSVFTLSSSGSGEVTAVDGDPSLLDGVAVAVSICLVDSANGELANDVEKLLILGVAVVVSVCLLGAKSANGDFFPSCILSSSEADSEIKLAKEDMWMESVCKTVNDYRGVRVMASRP